MKLQFLGAAGTVTGSRYLLSDEKHRLLVDCGMYQGVKNLRKRNWAPFPVEPSSINAVVLTHAHIDHTGYLPALVKNGFKGKIYCTKATHELCKVLLPDAGYLQEEDAKYAFRKGFSKHEKPEPLFTVKDAEEALKHFVPLHFHERFEPVKGMEVIFTPAGHILGSACVHVLYLIHKIMGEGRIPKMPVYLNSPMAIKATEIFSRHHKEHKLSAAQCEMIDQNTGFVRTVEESIELNSARYPCVIISASGMASGGRVLHHLKTLLPNPRNSVVFAGFQAPGTRGDALINGADSVKIHGEYWPVKAEVYNLDALSAHGDYDEMSTVLLKDLKSAT